MNGCTFSARFTLNKHSCLISSDNNPSTLTPFYVLRPGAHQVSRTPSKSTQTQGVGSSNDKCSLALHWEFQQQSLLLSWGFCHRYDSLSPFGGHLQTTPLYINLGFLSFWISCFPFLWCLASISVTLVLFTWLILVSNLQAYTSEILQVSCHHNKANIIIKQVIIVFGNPVYKLGV